MEQSDGARELPVLDARRKHVRHHTTKHSIPTGATARHRLCPFSAFRRLSIRGSLLLLRRLGLLLNRFLFGLRVGEHIIRVVQQVRLD